MKKGGKKGGNRAKAPAGLGKDSYYLEGIMDSYNASLFKNTFDFSLSLNILNFSAYGNHLYQD